MKNLITEFNQVGICKIDVEKVVKAWTDKFLISQYHEEFALIKQGRQKNYTKVAISKEQAEILIDKLKLLPIQSGLFRHVKNYRTESGINSERDSDIKMITDKSLEIEAL